MRARFIDLLEARWSEHRFVCIGLDLDVDRLPGHLPGDAATRCLDFSRSIVSATCDIAAAYKPNTAFLEALGAAGPDVLRGCIELIHEIAPQVPVIADAKRGDIANTNDGSVAYLFDYAGADAITVHPYLGHEALRPFLSRKEKGIFVLCRTSNPGAGELQDVPVAGGEPLFMHVAGLVQRTWNYNGNCGLVVGATYPDELARVANRAPDLPLLVPGIGAQGGDLEATVRAAHTGQDFRLIANASRSVLYASDQPDFADAARREVDALNDGITGTLADLARSERW